MQFLAFCDDAGHISVKDRHGFLDYVTRTFAGKGFVMDVKPVETKRSLAQNRWIWGQAYPLIAEHLGYDRHEHEQLHYDLLSVRFGTEAVIPKLPGALPRIVPKRTSSNLTVAEFSDYMDWLVRYAATEFGVVLPLPDDEPMRRTA